MEIEAFPYRAYEEFVKIANAHYDGHCTIMKFTTNWRAGFTTVDGREDIEKLHAGKSLEDALNHAMLHENLDLRWR